MDLTNLEPKNLASIDFYLETEDSFFSQTTNLSSVGQSHPQLQEFQSTQIVQNTLDRALNIASPRLEKFLESSKFEAGIEIAFFQEKSSQT